MFLLSKLLPLFVLPLGLAAMLLAWGIVRQKRRPAILGLTILLLASQPVAGRFLIRSAEAWAERPAVSSIGTADAVVVLSSGRNLAPGPDHVSEWVDADRFFGGVDIFKARKAPLLIFTGAGRDSTGRSEGDILVNVAAGLGVPADAMLVTGDVLNTADEARETAATLAGKGTASKRIVLVTSAFHMPRAREIFVRAGFDVIPFPVDFAETTDRRMPVLDFFPSVRALEHTQTAMREFYGRAFYWARDKF